MTIDTSPTAPPADAATERAKGREARRTTGRRELATLVTAGRDPLGILSAQNATRVPELVPLRTERMSASPFAFYRGTAALMAADLGAGPSSGILVASCGDAHVANFGFYASPQRTLVFDLNDFDEAAWAPWEWDLKRLVASIVIAGKTTARDDEVTRGAARAAVRQYVAALDEGRDTGIPRRSNATTSTSTRRAASAAAARRRARCCRPRSATPSAARAIAPPAS